MLVDFNDFNSIIDGLHPICIANDYDSYAEQVNKFPDENVEFKDIFTDEDVKHFFLNFIEQNDISRYSYNYSVIPVATVKDENGKIIAACHCLGFVMPTPFSYEIHHDIFVACY